MSTAARWLLRFVCDSLLVRMFHALQMTHLGPSGYALRLQPMHFLTYEFAAVKNRSTDVPMYPQLAVDTVADNTFLRYCESDERSKARRRKTSTGAAAAPTKRSTKRRETPYDPASLGRAIYLYCLAPLTDAAKCMQYINERIFHALCKIMMMAIEAARNRKRRTNATVTVQESDVAFAQAKLYNISVQGVEIALTNDYTWCSSSKRKKIDYATKKKTAEDRLRNALTNDQVHVIAYNELLNMHTDLNDYMANKMINSALLTQLCTESYADPENSWVKYNQRFSDTWIPKASKRPTKHAVGDVE